MRQTQLLIDTILTHVVDVQAIYLFGTWGTEDEWPDSDVDIALLFPPQTAKAMGSLAISDLRVALESALHKSVGLVNLRHVPTVLQHEIITTGRRLYCADERGRTSLKW